MSGIRARRMGGFTLIELMVAMAIAAFVLAAVASMMVAAKKSGLQNEARAQMSRESAFVNQLMAEDLRATGLGVPRGGGLNIENTSAGDFTENVIVANATEIMILGDRPRPDAQYNTFGLLHREDMQNATEDMSWMFHNENNGTCAPHESTVNCRVGDTSQFFPGHADACNTDSNTAWTGDPQPAVSRVCPWGMKRLRDGEELQIVSGVGDWANFDFNGEIHDDGDGGVLRLRSNDLAPDAWNDPLTVGINDYALATNSPMSDGEGWVTTLDRVIWRYDAANRRLIRNQCWGPAQPSGGAWNNTTAPGGTCTGDEAMLKDVESVTFTYFDGVAAPGANADIDRIEWEITLQRTVHDRPIQHAFRGTVGLRNPF